MEENKINEEKNVDTIQTKKDNIKNFLYVIINFILIIVVIISSMIYSRNYDKTQKVQVLVEVQNEVPLFTETEISDMPYKQGQDTITFFNRMASVTFLISVILAFVLNINKKGKNILTMFIIYFILMTFFKILNTWA